jgi:hypothetical protein
MKETIVKIDARSCFVLIAGIVLYGLFGRRFEHLHGLTDSLVIADLALRALKAR